MSALLQVSDLAKSFGGVAAVDGVSLEKMALQLLPWDCDWIAFGQKIIKTSSKNGITISKKLMKKSSKNRPKIVPKWSFLVPWAPLGPPRAPLETAPVSETPFLAIC